MMAPNCAPCWANLVLQFFKRPVLVPSISLGCQSLHHHFCHPSLILLDKFDSHGVKIAFLYC